MDVMCLVTRLINWILDLFLYLQEQISERGSWPGRTVRLGLAAI